MAGFAGRYCVCGRSFHVDTYLGRLQTGSLCLESEAAGMLARLYYRREHAVESVHLRLLERFETSSVAVGYGAE